MIFYSYQRIGVINYIITFLYIELQKTSAERVILNSLEEKGLQRLNLSIRRQWMLKLHVSTQTSKNDKHLINSIINCNMSYKVHDNVSVSRSWPLFPNIYNNNTWHHRTPNKSVNELYLKKLLQKTLNNHYRLITSPSMCQNFS